MHAIMLDRRNPRASMFSPKVQKDTHTFQEGDWTVRRFSMSYRDKQVVSEHRQRGDEIQVRKLLETEDDLDTLLSFPMKSTDQLHRELAVRSEQYLQECSEFPPDYGSMMLDLGEPIGFLYHNSNLQQYAIWSLACPHKVKRFLDRAMGPIKATYSYFLQRNLAEVYFLVGSELASPPLVSRQTFQQWIVPYAKELISMIHAHSALAIQHYHGQIKLILDDFVEMAPDGLHTIEAPPTGNCTMDEAYAVTGDRITLIGNIQYDLFRSLSADQIKQEVRDLVREVAGRRFILSPSAGPYEQTISPHMTANYLAFLEAAAEF
jgi:hypothetical protein